MHAGIFVHCAPFLQSFSVLAVDLLHLELVPTTTLLKIYMTLLCMKKMVLLPSVSSGC